MIRVRVSGDAVETPHVIEVPAANTYGVRPYRIDGLLTAQVREVTDPGERELVSVCRYAATWLGWHYGQTPGYGDTPDDAVRALAAGKLEWR